MQKTRLSAVLATFILCMVVWVLITWSFTVQELAAGVLAVLFSQVVPFKLHIVLASLLPSGLAAWLYLQHEKKSQPQKTAGPEEGSCDSIEGGTEA